MEISYIESKMKKTVKSNAKRLVKSAAELYLFEPDTPETWKAMRDEIIENIDFYLARLEIVGTNEKGETVARSKYKPD